MSYFSLAISLVLCSVVVIVNCQMFPSAVLRPRPVDFECDKVKSEFLKCFKEKEARDKDVLGGKFIPYHFESIYNVRCYCHKKPEVIEDPSGKGEPKKDDKDKKPPAK